MRRHGVPLAALLALTIVVFAPLVASMGDGVLRGPTDGAQVMRLLWSLDRQGETLFTAARDPTLGAPEGLPLVPSLSVAQPFQPAVVTFAAVAAGEVLGSNLFLLAGYFLTAAAAYFGLRRLALSTSVAVTGAAALAFNPWLIERGLAGHAAFTHMWPLLLLVAALVWVEESERTLAAAAAGVALGLCFLTSAYSGLLAAVVAAVLIGTSLVRRRAWVDRLWICTLASALLGVTLLFLLPGAVAYATNAEAVDAVATHGEQELGGAGFGKTLAGYVRPPAQHPLLGGLGFEQPFGTPNSEVVLYLGFTTIALALYGAFLVFRRREELPARLRFVGSAACVLAPVAFVLSLPPNVELGDLSVPLPSSIIAETTTFYRVYARFGFVVLLALVLLACIALEHVVRQRRRPWVALAAVALLAFEFLPGRLPVWSPDARATDRWLHEQPRGILANYPMPTDQRPALELAFAEQFRQRFHGQPLFTVLGAGTGGTREEAIRLLARYVDAPDTPALLAGEGVRYVVLHDDVYRAQGETPPEIPAGLTLVDRFDDLRLLRVGPDVQPADVDGVLEQQAASLAAVQGLEAPTVERNADGLALRTPDSRVVRAQLVLDISSTAGSQPVRLLDEAGAVRATADVSQGSVTLGPIPVHDGIRYRLDTGPGVRIGNVTAQPLADYSVSLREQP